MHILQFDNFKNLSNLVNYNNYHKTNRKTGYVYPTNIVSNKIQQLIRKMFVTSISYRIWNIYTGILISII